MTTNAELFARAALLAALSLVACDGDSSSDPDGIPRPGASEVADVVRMCLLNNACGYQSLLGLPADMCTDRVLDAFAASHYEYSPEHRLRHTRMLECSRTATSCDAYVSCANFDATCSRTLAGSCQGTVRDSCSTPGGGPPLVDCAPLGMTCDDSGQTAACVLPAGEAECTDPGVSTCDGDSRVHCRQRAGGGAGLIRETCPAGTTCQVDGTQAECSPTPGACAAEAASCDGDTVVYCMNQGGNGLRELRIDCAAADRTCGSDARQNVVCVPRATDCEAPSAGQSTARCDGTQLEVCVEGRLERVDCTALGRATCMPVPAIPGAQPATVTCAP